MKHSGLGRQLKTWKKMQLKYHVPPRILRDEQDVSFFNVLRDDELNQRDSLNLEEIILKSNMINFNCTEMGGDKGVHRLIALMPNIFKV